MPVFPAPDEAVVIEMMKFPKDNPAWRWFFRDFQIYWDKMEERGYDQIPVH